MSDELEPELERVARMLAAAGSLPDAPAEPARARAGSPRRRARWPTQTSPRPRASRGAGRACPRCSAIAAVIAGNRSRADTVLVLQRRRHRPAHRTGCARVRAATAAATPTCRRRTATAARRSRCASGRCPSPAPGRRTRRGSAARATASTGDVPDRLDRRRDRQLARTARGDGGVQLAVGDERADGRQQDAERRAHGALGPAAPERRSPPRATVRLAAMAAPSNSIDVLDRGFVRLDAVHGRRPLGRQCRARVVRGARRHHGRPQRGARALPHARAPRDAVRAQLLPLPHQGAAVRDARVAAPPRRLVQRALGPLLRAAGRVLRACGRRRAHAGRQTWRLHVRAARRGRRPSRCARASRRATRSPTATTRSCSAAGVAKEVARSVLPVGLYTEFYWSVNARSLMNFLSLRNSRDGAARDPRLRRGRRAALRAGDARHARGVRGAGADGSLSVRPRRELEVHELGGGVHRVTQPLPVGARPRPLLRRRRRRRLDADRLRARHAGHRPALAGGARAARAPARAAHRDHALPPRPHRCEHAPGRDHRRRGDRAGPARSRSDRAARGSIPTPATASCATCSRHGMPREEAERSAGEEDELPIAPVEPTRLVDEGDTPRPRRRALRGARPARAMPTATSRCSAGTAAGSSAATCCSTRSRPTSVAGRTTRPTRWAATSRRSRASRSSRPPSSTPAIAT